MEKKAFWTVVFILAGLFMIFWCAFSVISGKLMMENALPVAIMLSTI